MTMVARGPRKPYKSSGFAQAENGTGVLGFRILGFPLAGVILYSTRVYEPGIMTGAALPTITPVDMAGWAHTTRGLLAGVPRYGVFTRELFTPNTFSLAVQNGTAGDNGTAGGTLQQPVLGFMVG